MPRAFVHLPVAVLGNFMVAYASGWCLPGSWATQFRASNDILHIAEGKLYSSFGTVRHVRFHICLLEDPKCSQTLMGTNGQVDLRLFPLFPLSLFPFLIQLTIRSSFHLISTIDITLRRFSSS